MVSVLALVGGLTEVMHCGFILDRLHQKLGPIKATLIVYGLSISMPESLRSQTHSKAALFHVWERTIDFCPESDEIRRSSLHDREAVIADSSEGILSI